MKTIISTKILPLELNQLLQVNGFDVIQHDFINIKKTEIRLKNIQNQIIITSKNAIHVLEQLNPKLTKIFCVGKETEKKIKNNGFNIELVAQNAEDLAIEIVKNYSNFNFTYLCSSLRREILPQILMSNNIDCKEVVVYQTELQPLKILKKASMILFFSPSGVLSFLKENKITDEICICIGKTTAQELKKVSSNVKIASKTNIKSMVLEIIENFKSN